MTSIGPTPESNLALPDRKIWVVTTAALPWRTGTSINPLLRALHLTRGRPSESVCLVVPWLTSKNDRDVLYGKAADDWSQGAEPRGQEECIRNFASNECGMAEEENALRILFYRAAYVRSFGSIFPTEDICDLIPDEDADVAILEEPEHLNWFRVPSSSQPSSSEGAVSEAVTNCPLSSNHAVVKEELDAELSDSFEHACSHEEGEEKKEEKVEEEVRSEMDDTTKQGKSELGWTHKFRFVVGICHTNYAAYVKRYGIGASVIAAPAITAFNALVVRAYCNRVIKLSGVLQEFVPGKEVTCNVHGVRPDFLTPLTEDDKCNEGVSSHAVSGCSDEPGGRQRRIPCVYFIGKLLWAKGFDDMLEIQDRYRKRTGCFFPVDIYGGGPDENAIKRAFFGRRMPPASKNTEALTTDAEEDGPSVFSNPTSLRTQSIALLKKGQEERNGKDKIYSLGFEVTTKSNDSLENIEYVVEAVEGIDDESLESTPSPLNIIGDVSTSSFSTGVATSVAACKVGDAAVRSILSLVFTPEQWVEGHTGGTNSKNFPKYMFDPPQSRFELRRNPVPATFCGVMDHALAKSMPLKIFLNPSVSEVLCTTTAEALAMGKFVIIPRHPSNSFFEQFPNALMYDSLEGAVDKLIFAMESAPAPLDALFSRLLSWEAATERLIKASTVVEKGEDDLTKSAIRKKDMQIAWLHSEASKTTHFLGTILPGKK
mmetsp:Transcript_12386/g.35438  ORF Transcript_12386/g.35438 Transcript_12386/m.35438 type:complete len:712 (+) Transcript_12386:54-2189(+)